jgi:crossover junction endodeoxyribonuclease RuvC
MIVLGIDPGSLRTGYGVVEILPTGPRAVEFGVACAPPGPLADRLRVIGTALERVLDRHAPDVVAIEQAFHATNARSTLVLGQARGMALWLAARRDVPIHEFAPRTVKLAVTGRGGAAKQQVAAMVVRLLALTSRPLPDAADALAVALCCAQRLVLAPRVAALRGVAAAAPASARTARAADGSAVDLGRAFAKVRPDAEAKEFARLVGRARPLAKAPR